MSESITHVIKIGNRYFCRFGKGGRVMTAWSLAGARHYLPNVAYYQDDLDKLKKKDKKHQIVVVGVIL